MATITSSASTPANFMQHDSRIYIAGHRGLVGSAIHRDSHTVRLWQRCRAHARRARSAATRAPSSAFFADERPEFVFLAAAKVGGILANNTYPADFIRDNLAIQTNVIEASRNRAGVEASALPRLLVHLSQALPAAHQRGVSAHRAAGADQPRLRHRQDRRHRDVLELQPAIRHTLSGSHANQPLWSRR